MKYLFYEKETETEAKITLIYNIVPPERLLEKGNYITMEIMPSPENLEKRSMLYCNPLTGEVWYKYYGAESND